ncbi:MAG: ATP-binding protein [Candidatus Marinimicrobia bacterium]|jgi:hypothetical protein|nr:ATP-binding protein [Candidatus Neomarinimicrobiota bacterium]MBT4946491.1 ATP-binding protein [Candidatus Neomarinimicrobiota bacterium]MBT5270569.1 ATP-binding protein [Candidatus Neomarinimicrobiota bacterium]
MVEALRGLGYSTSTAIADIIDNSISACASTVSVNFHWKGENSRISILDDGCGMNEEELDHAMRLGDVNPLDARDENDLGRFGLGLKTASFSQCRRLTVASMRNNAAHCLRWDLDVLSKSEGDGWYMLEGAEAGSEQFIEDIENKNNGTIVLWEKLDRIITGSFSVENFLDLIDVVERHLSMVFHRFLENRSRPFSILINGQRLKPWDPFLTGNPSKPWHSPVSPAPTMPGVEVECHVLPHKDMLSVRDFEEAQGPEGWTAQQGFYVYRNKRLLLAGSWLGLGSGRAWIKDEAHRLARIRIDIPNSVDSEWKIDIRKSRARPPVNLRPWLGQLAEATRMRARNAFAYRGRVQRSYTGEEIVQAWKPEKGKHGVRYRIDHKHPSVNAVLDQAGHLRAQIEAMLRVLEETVPVQKIWLDTAEEKDTPRTGFDKVPVDEVRAVLLQMYKYFVFRNQLSPVDAKVKLKITEPFHNYHQLIDQLPDDLDEDIS